MKSNKLVCVGAVALVFGLIGTAWGAGPGGSHADRSTDDSNHWIPGPAIPAASAEQAVQDVIDGIAQGKIYVVWDALPASYQADMTQLVHGFATKVDAEIWSKSFETARKVAAVLENQKDVILSMPNLRSSDKFDADVASAHWDRVVAPIKTIANSPLADIHAFRNIDIRQFMGTTGSRFIADIDALSEISTDGMASKIASLGNAKATLVSQEGENAVVRIGMPGQQASEKSFVRVEGKWIPSDMAQDWADEMDEAKAKMATMSADDVQTMKPQFLQLLTSIDSVLDQMNKASTADEFEQAAQMGMMQVFGGLMSLSRSAQAD